VYISANTYFYFSDLLAKLEPLSDYKLLVLPHDWVIRPVEVLSDSDVISKSHPKVGN